MDCGEAAVVVDDDDACLGILDWAGVAFLAFAMRAFDPTQKRLTADDIQTPFRGQE